MATIATPSLKIRSDDIFFPAMTFLMLGIVLTGFAKTYFLAGMMRAKLPNKLVHIHGFVFVLWIFLLVIQAMLVASHKVKWHMRLGVFSLILLPSMFILGILTLFDFVRRTAEDPLLVLIGDLETIAIFVALASWGLLVRRDTTSHKRLMILATMTIMGPAISRWDIGIPATLGLILVLPLFVLVYDLWSLRRVARPTLVANVLNLAWILTLMPVSKMVFWQRFIEWIRHP